MSAPARRREGMVLVIVLVFALLLVSGIATFLRRATIDSFVVRNRDAAARAEALARGGVELGVALLLEDRLEEAASTEGGFRVESRFDPWARVADLDLDVGDGATLRLEIEDAGARLNLNALAVDAGAAASAGGDLPGGQDTPGPQSFTEADVEGFLRAFLEKVIEEMPGRPEQKNYEVEALVQNLMDWVDADDLGRRGGLEDEWYQGRTPPYRAPNGPLLSVDELRLVQGFDGRLVDALAPYVGVFPLAPPAGGDGEEAAPGLGVNPNTAPPWVLALLYHGDPTGGRELAKADEVAAIVKEREKHLLCARAGGDAPGSDGDDDALTDEACLHLLDAADVDPSTVFPPPTWESDFFTVAAQATVGEIRRRLEVVVDRSDPSDVRRLAWRMR